jgi:hypothetical protein
MRIEPGLLLTALLSALSVAPLPAAAQEITPALKDCVKVPDGATRLACYDSEMRRIEGVGESNPPHASGSESPRSPTPAEVKQPDAPVRSAPPARSTPPAPSEPPALPAASSSTGPTARPTPPPTSGEQFGLPPREPRTPSRITARVASASRQPSGRYIVTLENGQVWLQTEDELGFVPGAGSSVSIKRGLLGSYWMSDKHYVVAVRRLH